MDSSESAAGKQRKTAKRPLSEDAGAAEERLNQKKHSALCATLGGEDASVRLLEELVFGAEERLSERLAQDSSVLLEDDDTHSVGSEESGSERPAVRSAVWEDEDDELDEEVDMTHRFRRDFKKSEAENKMTKPRLQQRLKEQFQKAMGGTPSWAEVTAKRSQKKAEPETEDEDDSEELLRRTGNFIGSSDSLPKGIIKIKKCLNANSECPGGDQLSSVQFHPSAQIVMTAGLDHSVSLFQVDGKSNPKIQTIHLENYPVNKASFSADGEHIVATGMRNKLFYIYDMMEGKVIPVSSVRGLNEQRVSDFQVSPDGKYLLLSGSSGYLHLMTTKTREVIRSMKMNGSVCAAAFTSDSSKIFANSQEGEVFIWDVQSSKCLKKFADDGCIRGTSLALSRDGLYLACGSQSGVVNIYSQKDCLHTLEPRPLKAVMNLVTAATSLCFNSTSEILAIGSRADDEANRLVHLPSFTVFSNFPQFQRKTIFRTRCLDISPQSGFYTVANNKGHALLFRLLHYTDF
ncbi:U3 small nucleolar RNA-associated protein 18 homolog isoform X3 [Sinocyclocheilus rhinocerous]|uniref:U3 small nucleolar RNA-associated protein 18 homolog isoform X3 n=1 Tax=Sinocyclocheilus rhinocerous TaxID=307959 RepID=UPI0007B9D356|nr:PREDICTED: U3 small nucleolar RNA-associated protein 18 homolog isoform X3 [Sinocyclocheilus rhinocerous]